MWRPERRAAARASASACSPSESTGISLRATARFSRRSCAQHPPRRSVRRVRTGRRRVVRRRSYRSRGPRIGRSDTCVYPLLPRNMPGEGPISDARPAKAAIPKQLHVNHCVAGICRGFTSPVSVSVWPDHCRFSAGSRPYRRRRPRSAWQNRAGREAVSRSMWARLCSPS
jgi:hypothetical protein